MKITIDVIFVDAKGHILKLIGNVRPGLWSVSCRGARDVIELGGGALRECDLMPGDRLQLVSRVAKSRTTTRHLKDTPLLVRNTVCPYCWILCVLWYGTLGILS